MYTLLPFSVLSYSLRWVYEKKQQQHQAQDEIAERYVFICQHVFFFLIPFHNQRWEAATTEAFFLFKAEAFKKYKIKSFE